MSPAPKAKIGAAVFIRGRFGKVIKIRNIEGETKTSWRVEGNLYNKNNLRLRGSGTWSNSTIQLATDEEVAEQRAKFKHSNLVFKVGKIDFSKLTDDQLEQILKWRHEAEEVKSCQHPGGFSSYDPTQNAKFCPHCGKGENQE